MQTPLLGVQLALLLQPRALLRALLQDPQPRALLLVQQQGGLPQPLQ